MGLPLEGEKKSKSYVAFFPPYGRDILRQLTEDREGFIIVPDSN
jgi:hypothetical protein